MLTVTLPIARKAASGPGIVDAGSVTDQMAKGIKVPMKGYIPAAKEFEPAGEKLFFFRHPPPRPPRPKLK